MILHSKPCVLLKDMRNWETHSQWKARTAETETDKPCVFLCCLQCHTIFFKSKNSILVTTHAHAHVHLFNLQQFKMKRGFTHMRPSANKQQPPEGVYVLKSSYVEQPVWLSIGRYVVTILFNFIWKVIVLSRRQAIQYVQFLYRWKYGIDAIDLSRSGL